MDLRPKRKDLLPKKDDFFGWLKSNLGSGQNTTTLMGVHHILLFDSGQIALAKKRTYGLKKGLIAKKDDFFGWLKSNLGSGQKKYDYTNGSPPYLLFDSGRIALAKKWTYGLKKDLLPKKMTFFRWLKSNLSSGQNKIRLH